MKNIYNKLVQLRFYFLFILYLWTAPVSISYFHGKWQISIHDTGMWLSVLVLVARQSATPQLRQAHAVKSQHQAHLSCLLGVLKWSLILTIRLPIVRSQNSTAFNLADLPLFFPSSHLYGLARGFLFFFTGFSRGGIRNTFINILVAQIFQKFINCYIFCPVNRLGLYQISPNCPDFSE